MKDKARVRPETKEERRFLNFAKLKFNMTRSDGWQVQRAMRHASRLMRGLPLTDEDHECIRFVPDEARRRELTFAAVQKWLTTADGKDLAELGISIPNHAALLARLGDAATITFALDCLAVALERETVSEIDHQYLGHVKRLASRFREFAHSVRLEAFPPDRSLSEFHREVWRDWALQRQQRTT